MKRISVILPAFNEENNIEECLDSLLNQSIKNFEIIVVDDGSTDKTASIVTKYSSTNKNIKSVAGKHQGAGRARNLGVIHSDGEILVFVDADMTFYRSYLEKLIAPINENKTIGTYTEEEYVSNWDNPWARCWNMNYDLPVKKRHKKGDASNSKVFRAILARDFKRVEGFSKGGYTDDWSLSEKLGITPTQTKAICFHKNPSTLHEVFYSAKWAAKRKYKLGLIGVIVAICRYSLISSLVVGAVKAVKHKEPCFLLFKIIFNFAATLGVLEYYLLNNEKK